MQRRLPDRDDAGGDARGLASTYAADTASLARMNDRASSAIVERGAACAGILLHENDHFGGLVGFLQAHGAKLKRELPFILGGGECFCTREAGIGATVGNFGALDRAAIRAARLQLQFAERPSLIAGHGFTTGRIPTETFERVLAPSRMAVGVTDGLVCYPEGLPEAKRSLTTLVPDDFQHEQATAFVVKDKGLVVMTSCGHRGIVNSVRTARSSPRSSPIRMPRQRTAARIAVSGCPVHI